MKPKLIAQTAALLIVIAAAGILGHDEWRDAEVKRNATFHAKQKPAAVLPAPAIVKPEPAPPARYADVAQKDLFSKDRNPNVVIDPPKAEEKPMPPLPVVYGVMGLPSGMRALMSEKPGLASQVLRVGDSIGEFKLVALDSQKITFEWNGKQISRKIEELSNQASPGGTPGGPAVVVPAPAAPANSAQTFSPPGASQTQNPSQLNSINTPSSPLGVEVGPAGQSQRACVPGDTHPAGAVVDGYKKVVVPTPLGFSRCVWVQAQ